MQFGRRQKIACLVACAAGYLHVRHPHVAHTLKTVGLCRFYSTVGAFDPLPLLKRLQDIQTESKDIQEALAHRKDVVGDFLLSLVPRMDSFPVSTQEMAVNMLCDTYSIEELSQLWRRNPKKHIQLLSLLGEMIYALPEVIQEDIMHIFLDEFKPEELRSLWKGKDSFVPLQIAMACYEDTDTSLFERGNLNGVSHFAKDKLFESFEEEKFDPKQHCLIPIVLDLYEEIKEQMENRDPLATMNARLVHDIEELERVQNYLKGKLSLSEIEELPSSEMKEVHDDMDVESTNKWVEWYNWAIPFSKTNGKNNTSIKGDVTEEKKNIQKEQTVSQYSLGNAAYLSMKILASLTSLNSDAARNVFAANERMDLLYAFMVDNDKNIDVQTEALRAFANLLVLDKASVTRTKKDTLFENLFELDDKVEELVDGIIQKKQDGKRSPIFFPRTRKRLAQQVDVERRRLEKLEKYEKSVHNVHYISRYAVHSGFLPILVRCLRRHHDNLETSKSVNLVPVSILQSEATRALVNMMAVYHEHTESQVHCSCMNYRGRSLPNGVFQLYPLFVRGHKLKESKKMHGHNEPKYDIILVHGLSGHALSTWVDKGFKSIWPSDWLPEDLNLRANGFRILSVDYGSSLSVHFDKGGSLPLDLRAEHLVTGLRNAGVCLNGRQTIWITHSMGGLLVKEILAKKGNEDILASTRGIAFYSTPHLGSPLTKFYRTPIKVMFQPSHSVKSLHTSPRLYALNEELYSWVQHRDLKVIHFGESEKSSLIGTTFSPQNMIVNPHSGNPGVGDFILIPGKSHRDICKPVDKNDVVYDKLVTFLNDIFAN